MSKRSPRCIPENGVDLCHCGCKYWNHSSGDYFCFDCGGLFAPTLFDDEGDLRPSHEWDTAERDVEFGHAVMNAMTQAEAEAEAAFTASTRHVSVERAGYILANRAFDDVCAENARLRQALQDAGVPAGLVDAIAKGES
jgi:hypothetical protein